MKNIAAAHAPDIFDGDSETANAAFMRRIGTWPQTGTPIISLGISHVPKTSQSAAICGSHLENEQTNERRNHGN
jgi:hypothetical protein